MNPYFDPKQSRLWFLASACFVDNVSPMSLVVFGNVITASTESRWHFEESCFLKATLASFQFENRLMINALSWLLLFSLPSLWATIHM